MQAQHCAVPVRPKTSVLKRSSPTSSPTPTSGSSCSVVPKSRATSQARPSRHSTRAVSKTAGSSVQKALFPSSKTSRTPHIKRFQEQTEIVNIMESEDLGAIKAKINELKGRDPGAFAAEAMVVEVKEAAGGAEEAGGEVRPLTGEMALITARMKVIEKMVVDIGYRDKFAAGVYSGKIEGLMIGLIVSFALVGFLMMG